MGEEPNPPEGNKLYAAVCAVMEDLQRLQKSDKNKHGGYAFISVDDVKDEMRPLLAKHGLSIHVSQNSFEMSDYVDSKDSRKSIAVFDMAVTLRHSSGLCDEPENMTVALPMTGAQTSGIARSYVVKEYLKSRFLVSAGDLESEADLLEQAKDGLRLAKADARDLYATLGKELLSSVEGRDYKALAEWWQENKYRIETLPKAWYILMKTDYATAYKELKAQEDLDKMSEGELDEMAQNQEQR